MPLSMYALDNFVAQDLSQLTECRPAPIAPEFPDYSSWLSLFALNWILTIPLPKEKAVLAFALIRRAEGAIEDYEESAGPTSQIWSVATPAFRCISGVSEDSSP